MKNIEELIIRHFDMTLTKFLMQNRGSHFLCKHVYPYSMVVKCMPFAFSEVNAIYQEDTSFSKLYNSQCIENPYFHFSPRSYGVCSRR